MIPTETDSLRGVVGENIKRIRKENKLTVEELAEQVGLARGYWYQIEQGLPNVTLDVLTKIADALGVSVQDLLVKQPPKRKRA